MRNTALLLLAGLAMFLTTTGATCSPRRRAPEPQPIVVPVDE